MIGDVIADVVRKLLSAVRRTNTEDNYGDVTVVLIILAHCLVAVEPPSRKKNTGTCS